ncbi:hypothetical protein QF031_000378 [Pseudarthrobacter defluvii]|nr:hypothetical protein [Pseudarthrobacter defluvii]
MESAKGRTQKTRHNRTTLAQPFPGFAPNNPGNL